VKESVDLILVWGKMVDYWKLIQVILTRYSEQQQCSSISRDAALYIASMQFYRGKGYKNVIRLGKRVIDNHLIWENE
jgi:hypothetical protein